jgi:outer membrane protein assembly factor BamE (lipoprotein component of BamABCDE complex)
MSRLPSLALTLGLVLLATGCASTRERLANIDLPSIPGVYRATIQQGNVITQEMVDRLQPGMTPSQVRFILGEPILGNTFRDERWDYVYTIQVGAQDRQQQRQRQSPRQSGRRAGRPERKSWDQLTRLWPARRRPAVAGQPQCP